MCFRKTKLLVELCSMQVLVVSDRLHLRLKSEFESCKSKKD